MAGKELIEKSDEKFTIRTL